MHIIKPTEAMPVEYPVFCVYGPPGIGKTSLGNSAPDPLLVDADQGAHRAIHRRDTVRVSSYADIAELFGQREAFARYQTVVIDTVNRMLDLKTAEIIEQTPRYARDGTLTLQGYGALKSGFRLTMTQLRALNMNVVLLAHSKEERDGDTTIVRPDIVGASYGEVMKVADCVGVLYIQGKRRVLDFSPTDRWVGKNPVGWDPIVIPPAAKATHVLADLIEEARRALGAISTESAKQAALVEDWRAAIEALATAAEFNEAAGNLEKLPEVVKAQLRPAFTARVKTMGLRFDKDTKTYIAPTPAGVAS